MQKKRKRSFRKKIKLPLHKNPVQRFRMELRRREKTRAKSREKIARIKMQYKTKAVKQKGRQKEKAAGRVDRMLSAVVFVLGAGIMVLDGLLESRQRYPKKTQEKADSCSAENILPPKCNIKNIVQNTEQTEHKNQNTRNRGMEAIE